MRSRVRLRIRNRWKHAIDKSASRTSTFNPAAARSIGRARLRYRGPPMTLANMRRVCGRCGSSASHHEAVLNVDDYGDAVPVPAFGPRMVCTRCGIVGAFARPNWQERAPHESLTGRQWHC